MKYARTIPAPILDFELRGPRTRPALSAWARLRGPWLDPQFATGVRAWTSSTHAARALQLTSDRNRYAIARSLERLLKEVDRPSVAYRGGPIPLCRSQVREAQPEILSIAARMRSPAPVDVLGTAMLLELLRDGCGPFYVRTRPGMLVAALRRVLDHLDAPD
jgi:hypothetical protein